MTDTPDATADPLADLTDEERLHLVRLNPALHFGGYMQIYDKANQLRPADPNILQLRMNVVYMTLRALGVPIRMLVCKIRQCGGTTFGLELIYTHCQNQRTEAVVIADINDNSEKILTRLGDYNRNDSFPWGNRIVTKQGQVKFTNGSCVEVDSAQAWNPGVSRTRQAALFSEDCKWPRSGVRNDQKIAAAVLPSIPNQPNTLVIAEGTPEGASGWKYEMWQGALYLDEFIAQLEAGVAVPGNGWVKVFAAWFEFKENTILNLKPDEAASIMRTLSEREKDGLEAYGWTVNQIAWRRATVANECGGSEDAFDEYYPEDDERCWLSSGRPRFNQRAIVKLKARSRSLVPMVGRLVYQETGAVSWSADDTGDIEIYEEPRAGCRYLVTCDPATGEDQTESDDPDRHHISVLRAPFADQHGNEHNIMMVARVKAPFQGESDMVATHIANLSRRYGRCLVVLEMNMGLHVLELLKIAGVPLYKRAIVDDNAEREEPRLAYGFKMKDKNLRRSVLDCLAQLIRDQKFDCFCLHALEEMRVFRVGANGDERAPAGKHDDDVLGLAMGAYAIGSATLYMEPARKARPPADRKRWKPAYPVTRR